MFTSKTSLIIPTKDRTTNLVNLIAKLEILNLSFHEILIIDSSNIKNSDEIHTLSRKKKLGILKLSHRLPIKEILV